jgi:hypothetical protein
MKPKYAFLTKHPMIELKEWNRECDAFPLRFGFVSKLIS